MITPDITNGMNCSYEIYGIGNWTSGIQSRMRRSEYAMKNANPTPLSSAILVIKSFWTYTLDILSIIERGMIFANCLSGFDISRETRNSRKKKFLEENLLICK
jgi:hypothetical protein